MSIEIEVKKLVLRGDLIDRRSPYTGDSGRKLYVTPEIYEHAEGPFPDTLEGHMFGEMAADFESFCEVNEISVSNNPFDKPPDTMLARTHPVEKEFWSMRITDPEGSRRGLRVLGGFCAKDAFVALTWDYRDNIGDNFNEAVCDLNNSWADLFENVEPYSGTGIDDYLTNYKQQ